MMTGTKFDIEKFDRMNDFGLWQITKETTAAGIWKTLKTLYIKKSLANRLYLKKKLYTFHMHSGKSHSEYIDEFNKLVGYFELQKMTEAKGNGGERLYVRGRSDQRDVEHGAYMCCQSHKEEAADSCYICQSKEHLKRDYPRYNHKKYQSFVKNEDQVSGFGANRYDSTNVMMTVSVEELLD
ncbi:hypothetical protein Tco_1445071 [Tanacetum coccineum]